MTSRRRLLATAVLVAGAVQPSPALGGPSVDDRPAARAFTVTASLSDTSVLLGERTVLAGKVRPARDAKVLVQLRVAGDWKTVARRPLDDAGRYRYAFVPDQPGEHTYRAKMPTVGPVKSATSPRRTLVVAEQALIVFRIPAGTGASDWNTAGTTVQGRVGDTLRLINDDSMSHRLHTGGAPFPHPDDDLLPGASQDFVLETAYDSGPDPVLYCHIHGPGSQFWLDVAPGPNG